MDGGVEAGFRRRGKWLARQPNAGVNSAMHLHPSKWRPFDWFVLVSVLGIALAIVIPNFIHARAYGGPSRSCTAKLRLIHETTKYWAVETKRSESDVYSLTDPSLLACFKGSLLPSCPEHGRYMAGTNLSDLPKCSIGGLGHTL
jgi:hypothetical protein